MTDKRKTMSATELANRIKRGEKWALAEPATFEASADALRNTPLRQALDQLPDTTKMIEPSEQDKVDRDVLTYGQGFMKDGKHIPLHDVIIDRGAWSDVPDATQWVDELRGGDEEWTPEDMAYRPNGLSLEEPIGEIVEAHGLIGVSIPEMPPVGTKLYTAPPKREWQWLTYRELQEIMDSMKTLNSYDITDIYTAVEAKLKEKNTI